MFTIESDSGVATCDDICSYSKYTYIRTTFCVPRVDWDLWPEVKNVLRLSDHNDTGMFVIYLDFSKIPATKDLCTLHVETNVGPGFIFFSKIGKPDLELIFLGNYLYSWTSD